MVMLASGKHDQLSQVEDATPRNAQSEGQKMLRCLGTIQYMDAGKD